MNIRLARLALILLLFLATAATGCISGNPATLRRSAARISPAVYCISQMTESPPSSFLIGEKVPWSKDCSSLKLSNKQEERDEYV